MSKSKILFQLSGSISCFKAAQVISTLVQKGHEVKCAVTKNTFNFIGRGTLEGLTGSAVFYDSFETGRMMDHIALARWADIFVLCPATANTINKLAHGIADDVIGQLFLAKESHKPYFIFPAMNHEMYKHALTQNSLKTLSDLGVNVTATGLGHQACGEEGLGRLLEPYDIIKIIEGPKNSLKILVTGGGTREPIDDVRFISNLSTGKTASTLADSFIKDGHHVTYLGSRDALKPKLKARVINFSDYTSLYNILKTELNREKYDVIIHAAAVSDYSLSKIHVNGKSLSKVTKLNSEQSEITLQLKKNKKIITELKKWSPKSYVVAFKLTSDASQNEILTAVEKLSQDSNPDMIIHNDYSEMKTKDSRTFHIFSGPQKKTVDNTKVLGDLARLVLERTPFYDSNP